VRTSRAADDPRSAALVLRVPAPQGGNTPADYATVSNSNAEVRAFFASGQVRPIRVQSEVLRGHSEATQKPSEATQWPSEGSQNQRPSLAIIRNQQHTAAHKLSVRRACACARVRSTCRRSKMLSLLQLSLRASPSPALSHHLPAVRRRRQPPIRFHRPLLELYLLPSCTLLNNARLWPRSR
jgi:hypothetical protein